jgi:FAD/FMN-containing dehydrogenase
MHARLAQTRQGFDIDPLKHALADIVGADGVRDDAATLAFYSEDIWSPSQHRVALVVSPRSQDEVVAVIKAAQDAGVPIAPRGAGMSYTSSYIPAVENTLSLDMARMNRVLSISPEDMTVTVEPGCTWSALNAALKPLGLRTPFWGPMSGLTSTIGGGLSQLNAMLGAGHYGTSSESVIALTMVLADGEVLRTGARGVGGDHPFYRHYGPDLTGIFCGDSGAFGIKTEIVLRLIRAPQHEDYASFSFPTGEALLKAMAEMARASVASEMCAFDPGLTRVRMKRASLASDVKTLGAVISKEKSLGKGLMSAAKVAMGGRSFIDDGDYPLHIIAEGRAAAAVAADLAEARRIAKEFGGHEIENTIAKVIRAIPFPPLNSMLGPEGEAWVPVHGMVALSQGPALFAALEALFAELAPTFAREGISTGYLFTTVSTNAVTIEPVFYWPEERRPIHEASVEAAHLARLPKLSPNPGATAVVAEARKRVVEVCEKFGAGHFQIGRSYPYRESRDVASMALLDAIKNTVDPDGRINPGVLGFPLHTPNA